MSGKVSVFLLFLILFPTFTYANWKAVTPLNAPRDQFTCGVIDGKIYAFGGNSDPDGRNLKSTEMFDPANDTWSFRADNEHNNGHGVEELTGAVVNGKFYVFGAWGGNGDINFVEEYDSEADTWTSMAPRITDAHGAPAVAYNEEIYLFGGQKAGNPRTYYDVVEAYNPATNTWRTVTIMPRLTINHAVSIVGDRAYVIGGYDPVQQILINDIIIYDFITNKWITTGFAPVPTPKVFSYAGAAPEIDGKIYLIGGIEGNQNNFWISNVVEIYDTLTNTWSTGEALPQPTEDHCSVALDRSIYMLGGVIEYGELDDVRTNSVWKLDLSIIPIPDIKANGSDGPVTVSFGDPFTLTVQLDAGSMLGQNADWWAGVNVDGQWYHYDLASGWVSGKTTTHQGALFNLNPYTVSGMSGLPIGTYTFYFAVDMVMNGLLDLNQIYYDSVVVNITP
jgi:N-acetylneuraminic acid mutarotase